MNTIYQYDLPMDTGQTVSLPEGNPRAVMIQDGKAVIWIEHNLDRIDNRKMVATCIGTGFSFDPETIGVYLGSVQESDAPFVWHYYLRTE